MFGFGNQSALGTTSTPAKPTGLGSFSFGTATSTAPTFGTPATTKPPFGMSSTFGTPAFGSTGFGTTTNTQSTGFSGFGNLTSTTPALGTGFGFGQTPAASSAPIFGGTSNTSLGFGGFGTTTSTAAPFNRFGTFGTTTSSAPAFSGFGLGFGQQMQQPGMPSLEQQQQQQQQQQQANASETFCQAIFNVSVFGDERDNIIAKWNYLQALWGVGKAYYSATAPPVEITPENWLCRFKTVAYNLLPSKSNKEGCVSIIVNKPYKDFKDELFPIYQIFGNRVITKIDWSKNLGDKTQVFIYVDEKSQMNPNETRRVPATEVCNYLNQPMFSTQLANMGIESAVPYFYPEKEELEKYLANPPMGIDPRIWEQAKKDNQMPSRLIPVPIIGFKELKKRYTLQDNECELHVQCLQNIKDDISKLNERHIVSKARINQFKTELFFLKHRILKIAVKQECTRKYGIILSREEEMLKTRLQNLRMTISVPTQFRGCLRELRSQMRMSEYPPIIYAVTLNTEAEEPLKDILLTFNKMLKYLIEIMKDDQEALDRIKKDAPNLLRIYHDTQIKQLERMITSRDLTR